MFISKGSKRPFHMRCLVIFDPLCWFLYFYGQLVVAVNYIIDRYNTLKLLFEVQSPSVTERQSNENLLSLYLLFLQRVKSQLECFVMTKMFQIGSRTTVHVSGKIAWYL